MAKATMWGQVGMRILSGLSLCSLLTDATPAEGRTAWISGIFVYADVCTPPGTALPVGHRVALRLSPNGGGLTYQGTGQVAPQAAGAMTFDGVSRAIRFVVETESGPLRFEGIATRDALVGTFADADGAHPVHLPRTLRSHTHEPCPDGDTHPAALTR